MESRDIESRLETLLEEELEKAKTHIQEMVREAADRVLATRLDLDLDDPEDPWLTREQAMEEFQVPYWKVRDLELKGQFPVIRRGKTMVARRSDLARYLAA